jgi:dipeptidyl aminopeptidase/acylaminoacyl peptidase
LIPVRNQPWSLWIGNAKTYSATSIWQSGDRSRDSLPHFARQSLHFAAGNHVVFDSEQDGWNHLYSIATTGGTPVLLTPGEFDVEDVSLSADRKQVLFSNQGDIDRRHLWRVSVWSGEPQSVLTQ